MAGIPVIRTGPTISIIGANVDISGNVNVTYANSLYLKFAAINTYAVQYSGNSAVAALGQSITAAITVDPVKGPSHVSSRAMSIMPLTTVAGSYSFYLNKGSIARWQLGNNNDYPGGFAQVIIDPTSTPNIGVAAVAGNSVSFVGLEFANSWAGSAESMFEAAGSVIGWVGREITLDGGTSTPGNELDWPSISLADRSQTRTTVAPLTGNYFGHVEDIGGPIRMSGPVQIGNSDGTTPTYFLDKISSITCAAGNVNQKWYRIDVVGNTTMILGDSTGPSSSTLSGIGANRLAIDTATDEPNEFSIYGMPVSIGRAWNLGSTSKIIDSTISDVTDITLNAATDISGTTFIKSYLIAAFIPSPTLWANIIIRDVPITDYGITISGNYTNAPLNLNNVTFLSNAAGKDINFAHTGSIDLTVTNGGTIPSYTITGGGTVNFVTGVTVTITAQVSLIGAEVRIYDLDSAQPGNLGTELSGVESNTTADYVYTGTAANAVWIQILLNGYVEFGQQLVIPSNDAGFKAILSADINA